MLMVSSRTSGAIYLWGHSRESSSHQSSLTDPLLWEAGLYLLVPTRWLGAMSMVSVMDSWRTARPRSAMAHIPFFFTRMFLDLRSR